MNRWEKLKFNWSLLFRVPIKDKYKDDSWDILIIAIILIACLGCWFVMLIFSDSIWWARCLAGAGPLTLAFFKTVELLTIKERHYLSIIFDISGRFSLSAEEVKLLMDIKKPELYFNVEWYNSWKKRHVSPYARHAGSILIYGNHFS